MGVQSGAYLLRIQVSGALEIVFGRFAGGRPITVPAGIYLYIGSAAGPRGSGALAHRLVRHAARAYGSPPQAIMDPLLAAFRDRRLGPASLQRPSGKKLYWHVDYLLESLAVAIRHILVLRSGLRLEDELASRLARDPEVGVLVKGLGAADSPGATHLLRAPDRETWWWDLVKRLGADFQNEES